MTIAIGMRFRDGLVLAADQELSVEGSHKFQEEKIFHEEGKHWELFFSYADTPTLAKEAQEKITNKLSQIEDTLDEQYGEYVTIKQIREVTESTLIEMGRRQYEPLRLQMLIVGLTPLETPEMWIYSDGGFHIAEPFTPLGMGDLSLIKYLEMLHSFKDTLEIGERFATYLVSKAIKHIHRVGGSPDIVSIKGFQNWNWVGADKVSQWQAQMEAKERELLRGLILPPLVCE